MRNRMAFAMLAGIAGLAITFWARSNMVVTSDADIIQPAEKLVLAPDVDGSRPPERILPMSNPYLPIRELEPVY